MSFDVSVKNPVSRSRTVTVKLFIDGQEKSSKSLTIGGGSTGSVTLTWTAQAGEHDYRIEAWEDGKLEASRSGEITVSGVPSDLFNVVLTVYPHELEGGGEVYLQVKAWNYDRSPIQVRGFIEVDGERIKNITAEIPVNANGDSLLVFSHPLIGIGNHTIKLFLDNYDGKPNGAGEEHWSEVRVTVKTGDQLKQVTSECDPIYFKYNMGNYEATLTCRLTIYNGYSYDLKVTGDIVSDIDVSILNKYLQFPAGSFSPVVSYIDPKTIPTGGYSTITSIAHFKISKPDIFVIGDIFPYWEDAWNDIQVEGIYGARIPVKIIHDVPFDKLGIQRFTLQSRVYVEVDHMAVVADIAADALLTYKLGKRSAPIANIKFIQDILNKLPPEANWLANWMKEYAITWWRG